ncbi:hypothetical protein [Saccharicrinis fermentans]|uniref:Uncharacterized protein n=1 Tax=Saccharicrinis fermentans DSM 9555 = JCM 21142 TaxID=869213 RepID=W7YJL5_9BACT|nr:hypothetical protein [Saccharicrinis fermentans]GAF04721.1 hypothetical protein JCM21142_93438 [Saccharicrinis fermentans DSM 9555 = JCM 21142]
MSEFYKVQYRFLKDYHLVIKKHIGLIELDKLIRSTEMLCLKKEFSEKTNFLIDLRAARFSKDVEKVKDFVVFLNDSFPFVLNNKIAFITEESDQVAMATLFKMFQSKLARNIQVFNAPEFAFLWLNILVTPQRIEELMYCTDILDYRAFNQ